MRQNNKRAFTLVEVLIVIVIIGILFIVLMANVDFSTDEAKETGTKAIMQSYKLAAETIALENSGFTNDKAELVKVLNKRLDLELQLYVEGGEIKSKQTDSWGKEFKFMQSTPVNTYGMFAIQSAGPDGLFDNGDDIIMENKYVVVNGVGQVVTEFPEIDPNHSHSYVLRVTEPLFLKSPATCVDAAVYYYSCSCGKMNGTEFDFGVPDPEAHGVTTKQHIKKVPVDYAVHKTDSQCSLCGTSLATVENPHRPDATGEHCVDCGEQLHIHIYDKEIEANQYKKNDANCTEPLTYFKSCECGAASPDETFTKGSPLGHNYTKQTLEYKASNATCVDYAKYYLTCYGCGEKSSTTYDYVDGGKSATNHVGGTRVEYTRVDDLRHIKDTICNGCGAKLSSITEPHAADGECCHTHSYTKTVESSAYEKTALTCTTKAVYYKSCECGKSSQGATNETFEGSATPTHLPATSATWDTNHTKATVACTRTGCTQTWSSTSVNEITTTTATCVTERQYKHRASINVNGTSKTFDCTGHTGTTNASNHLKDPEYPKIESICKWYPCCETVIDGTHNWNVSAANCQTAKKCVDCGFVAEEATDHSGSLVFANIAGVCQKYSGCGCTYSDHDLGSAACTTAASCKRSGCSYSSGSPIGHLVNTSSAIWNSDHSSVKFICSRAGCSSSWDLSTTEKVTTTANCVTAKQYKHTLTVSISGNVTINGNTSLECSGHTGSVDPSTHASGCVWEPVSSPTSTLCQKRSKCGATDTSHDYNVTSINCGSSVSKKYCTTCDYLAQNRPEHTPVYGGTSSVHRKCSVCGTTLEGSTYHNYTLSSGGTDCEQPATYRCACGHSYQSTSSHDWEIIQEDTCLGEGIRKCKKPSCGKEETFNDINGHNFPSSGEPDWEGCRPYYECQNNNCDEKDYKNTTTETTVTATCITARQYRHKVTLGGKTYYCNGHTGDTDKSNHEDDYTAYVGPAGTGVANICEYYPCCGTIYSSAHDYDRLEATCTSSKKCTICDYVAQSATGHSGSPVYPSGGGTAYVHTIYSGCGHTYSSTHSFDSASCTEPATCACGYSTGGPKGHGPWVAGDLKTSATCTSAAVYYLKCDSCGLESSDTTTVGTALGHSYTNACDSTCNRNSLHTREAPHSPGAAATCTTSQKCTICNAILESSLGHNYIRKSNATCSSGSIDRCSRCGDERENNDQLKHSLTAIWEHDDTVVTIKCNSCGESYKDSPNESVDIQEDCTTDGSYHHYVNASMDDTTGYFSCGKSHTIKQISHVARADDGNCMTAIYCKYGCGTKMVSANGAHNYPTNCTTKCQNANCNVTRTAPHTWQYTCSTKCSDCSVTRSASHSNTSAKTYSVCQKCTYCGATTDSTHSYSLSHCDRYCDDCGYDRGASYTHEYSWSKVSTRFHQGYCGYCGQYTSASSFEHDMDLTYTPKGAGWSNKHYVDGQCTMCSYSYEDAGPYDCYDYDNSGRCDACNQLC